MKHLRFFPLTLLAALLFAACETDGDVYSVSGTLYADRTKRTTIPMEQLRLEYDFGYRSRTAYCVTDREGRFAFSLAGDNITPVAGTGRHGSDDPDCTVWLAIYYRDTVVLGQGYIDLADLEDLDLYPGQTLDFHDFYDYSWED